MTSSIRKVLITFALVISVFFAGCIRSPLTTRPKVIIDHVNDCTKIYVHAQELKRYNWVEIKINQTVVVNETKVYCVTHYTNLTEFILNITVADSKDIYHYDCSIKILKDEMEIVISEVTARIKIEDLPIERIMVKE